MRAEMGKIIVADDQMINLESLRMVIEKIGVLDFSEFFIDG